MKCSSRPRTVRAIRVGTIVLALVASAAILTACSAVPTDSGIVGTVTIGPTQPVGTPGISDTRPYAAELSVAPKEGLHLKRPVTVTSGADGGFKVNLEPGTYVITAGGAQSPPTLAPIEVVVAPHQFAQVRVAFDSGIR